MILDKVIFFKQVSDICKDNVDRILENYNEIYNKIT